MIPVSIFMGLNIVNVNEKYQFAQMQQMGLEYNITLRSFIQKSQQHRGLSLVYLSGKEDLKGKILLLEEEIINIIGGMDEINTRLGKPLHVNNDWNHIKNQWLDLKDELYSLDMDVAYIRYTDLIDQMLVLNLHVANNSQLFLQPNSESYYLVEMIINQLPYLTEYMGQARAIGSGVAAKKDVTTSERNNLIYLRENISESLKKTSTIMDLALEAPQSKGHMDSLSNGDFEAAYTMLTLLDEGFINQDIITLDSYFYFEYTTEAIDSIYSLLVSYSNAVEESIFKYIDNLYFQRNILVFITFLTLIMMIYLFLGFYLSINRSVDSIKKACKNIANGSLTERVALTAQDETKEIETSLNQMLDILNSNFNEVKLAKMELERIAYRDGLTGVFNRKFFMDSLDKTIGDADQEDRLVCLMFIDLDKFKSVNDTFGHDVGDMVLKSVASLLTKLVGDSGVVFRIGGDEFTILIPNVKKIKDIKALSKSISDRVENLFTLNKSEINIGASIGYAFYPLDAKNGKDLLKKADMVMYNNKQRKR